jgi:plastocyanin
MRYPTTLSVLALAAFAASGCGGGGDNKTTTTTSGNTKPSTTPTSAAATGGTAAGGGKAATKASVDIKDFKYGPDVVTVKSGAKVTWKNSDSAQHTATADNKAFDTGTLQPGDSKVVTLSKPGTFAYTCLFHPFMKGRVVVH